MTGGRTGVRRGLRRWSRPLFVFGIALLTAAAASSSLIAQDPVRPWLRWRSLSTEHYRFHYLPELEGWTRDVAERVEAVDSAIAARVGWSVIKPMHVVVDDPFIRSNGYAIPFLDKPVTVWYATPPDPRNDIGNFRTWGELLSVHELTHIAHLARPSRNPFQRSLWSSLPVNVGPIALRAPRWLFEGYATVVEGQITGTGRPNNAWRPAILRQWAIEGHLPSYGQLSAFSDFVGGEFAYLGGSAFLEWLLHREGDSSVAHLWRRMTARRVRGFDAAFRGVYGDSPSVLYGLHTAELIRDAMAVKALLDSAGIVQGELVQRLSWSTGDPAVSPNGERIAIALWARDRPGRLVVWNTAQQPEDTAAIRRRIDALRKDPQDVPDRRFYPVAKKAETTLPATNGRSYQMPRWYADNRRVLTTRWTARGDGTLSPALYEWDTRNGHVRQVTRPVGVLHADPHPDGTEAVAMQCHWGHCDIVRVDLQRGAIRTLLEGTPDRTYYRPRYSPDGSRFVASVVDNGVWRLIVSRRNGDPVTFVDPGDGANRYDAQWLGPDSLVVVSERGGIPNLETLSIATSQPRALTRVTGAAVAPEVNPRDGSIWFLALHSRGLDVRRLARHSATADSAIAVAFDRFGFAGTRGPRVVEFPANAVSPPRPYGNGPRNVRWLPGAFASGDGAGAFISVYSGDLVGRLNATVTGAYGGRATAQGGALRAIWRYPRPHLEMGAHGAIHEPSFGRHGQPAADSVDGSLVQGLLALRAEGKGESWAATARFGGGAGRLSPRDAQQHSRSIGFGELTVRLQQSRGARGLAEHLRLHASAGQTRASYRRMLGTLDLRTTGRDMIPIQLQVTAGRMLGSPHPFELFTIGGAASPVMDGSLVAQRYSMPMFPTGVAAGPSLLGWRAAFPGAWTLFYEGASTAPDLVSHRRWHRAIGMDVRVTVPNMPVAFLPGVDARVGAAYTLDAPFRKKVRAFLEMAFEP